MGHPAPSLPTFADAIAELKAGCAYYVNGQCDILACARKNGCPEAQVLFALREHQAALKPFAIFACDEQNDCFNCRARAVLTKWEIKP